MVHSEETKKKLSNIAKEKWKDPEHRKNHICSEEIKKKMSESHKGKKRSEEFKKNMTFENKRRWADPETRKRLIKGLRNGKKRDPMSIESKNNLSKKLKGRVVSQETKNKLKKHFETVSDSKEGKHEKPILDYFEKLLTYPINRQHKVGKYYLDGYCGALNLAIEIDEDTTKHYNIEKDKIRENEIKEILNCRFLRVGINQRMELYVK